MQIGAASVGAAAAGGNAINPAQADDDDDNGSWWGEDSFTEALQGGFIDWTDAPVTGWLFEDDTRDAEEASEATQDEIEIQRWFDAAQSRARQNERIVGEGGLLGFDGPTGMRGLERIAFEEAQAKAVEAMNAGETQDDTIALAEEEVDKIFAEPLKTGLEYFSESSAEVYAFDSEFVERDGIYSGSHIYGPGGSYTDGDGAWNEQYSTIELPNGEEYEIQRAEFEADSSGSGRAGWTPEKEIHTSSSQDPALIAEDNYGNTVQYLEYEVWNDWYESILDAWDETLSEVNMWVLDVYDQWQSGDIDESEVFTTLQLAEMAADDESLSRAHAELIALNIETELERAVKIETEIDGHTWQLVGMLAATSSPSDGFEVGESYTPDSDTVGTVYIVGDSNDAKGWYDDYDTGIDGGEVTFNTELPDFTIVSITTNYEETVSIQFDDFEPNDDRTEWTIDLTDELEEPIAEIEKVELYEPADETSQIRIENDFEIQEIVDQETGEEFESIEITEPNTSSPDSFQNLEDFEENWKEWEQLYDEMEKRFEEVEGETSFAGPGGGFLSDPIGYLRSAGQYAIYAVVSGLVLLFLALVNAAGLESELE